MCPPLGWGDESRSQRRFNRERCQFRRHGLDFHNYRLRCRLRIVWKVVIVHSDMYLLGCTVCQHESYGYVLITLLQMLM